MRHRVDRRTLGRFGSHRRAMLSNMAAELFLKEKIETTLPRAKELRRVAERLITKAKLGGLHNRRLVISRMPNKMAVQKLFDDIAKRYANRNGGYTRIVRTTYRFGDGAQKAIIELVEES